MILENVILKVIEQQKDRFLQKDPGLKRELDPHISSLTSHALIISGIRRCGKSTFLLQMMQSMNLGEVLFLNFDTPQLYGFSLQDFSRLDNIILNTGATTLFFDEMQLIEGWEVYVRQKLDEGFKVIVTGSNASMLSKELGTRLTGRHITRELFPFSFTEFLKFRNLQPTVENLENYMMDGGFPEYLKSRDEEQLITLYDDILVRDIVARHGVKDNLSLYSLANFLISNVGNKVTASKLRQPLSVGASSTILSWFSYLEQAYLFSFLPMFSYSAKTQLINPRKIYTIDLALINLLSGSKTEDKERKLENLVFLHLRREFSELYYFKDKGECDFVVFKNGKLKGLIQVCYDLSPDNMSREISGLISAMKFFKINQGSLVTMTDSDKIVIEGFTINVIPASRFLCEHI